MDMTPLSISDLLRSHVEILEELRRRDVVRSGNSPSGDYAELLFSRAFDWTLEANSAAGYDARDAAGKRIQIKCRRVTARNPSRQLSALRGMGNRPFDLLAAVLLDQNFEVLKAALIPFDVVLERSAFTKHVNAHRFVLRDAIWQVPGVEDVTDRLRAVQGTI
jgi:hypothetical protein